MTLSDWQHICAWLALVVAAIWTAKFLLLLAVSGEAGALQPLTGFLMPTLGSLLGVVASFGVAAPAVRQQSARIAVPALIAGGLVTVFVVSMLSNAAQTAVSSSPNEVVRTEAAALAAGLLWFLVATWLFASRRKHADDITATDSTSG
jgi:hypothetical protein